MSYDFEGRVSHSLLHINDLPFTTSQINLPDGGFDGHVKFVQLNGDKLYTAADKTLYVYLVSDTTSPIATYSLSKVCFSCIIIDNRLYLGGRGYLEIFDLKTSLSQPLRSVTQIKTKNQVHKLLRVGH